MTNMRTLIARPAPSMRQSDSQVLDRQQVSNAPGPRDSRSTPTHHPPPVEPPDKSRSTTLLNQWKSLQKKSSSLGENRRNANDQNHCQLPLPQFHPQARLTVCGCQHPRPNILMSRRTNHNLQTTRLLLLQARRPPHNVLKLTGEFPRCLQWNYQAFRDHARPVSRPHQLETLMC